MPPPVNAAHPPAVSLPRHRGPAGRRLGIWARAAVSVTLLGLLLAMIDPGAMARIVAGAHPGLLAAMFALTISERLFAAWRWLVLLRVAEPGVRFWPVLRITFISNFVGIFLPGGIGIEVLRIIALSRLRADLPLALSSVLVERLCGFLSLVLMIALGLLLAPIELPYALDLVVGGCLMTFVAAVAALVHPGPRRLARAALDRPVLGRARAALAGLERRLDTYAGQPGALLWSLALAAAFQALRIGTIVVGALALGIAVDPVVLVVVVPVGMLVGGLPISIGGFGPREASYVALLGLAGVSPEAALALALTREALNLASTLPGAVMYARAPLGAQHG